MADNDRNEAVDNLEAKVSITWPDGTTTTSPGSTSTNRVLPDGSGDGLATQVERALIDIRDNQGGHGKVIITPKADGSLWTWDKDITFDPTAFESILVEADGCVIDYPGTGWAMTFDNVGGTFNGDRHNVSIKGGTWIATASSASGELGFVRLIDVANCIFRDMYVDFNASVSAETIGWQMRNRDRWCEMNLWDINYVNCDVNLDFVPAYKNPNSNAGGTSSFQGTEVRGGNWHCQDACFRLYGNHNYTNYFGPQGFMFGPDSTVFSLGGNSDELIFSKANIWGLKAEEHDTNTSAFRIDDAAYDGFYQAPTVLGGHFEDLTNAVVDTTGGSASNMDIDQLTQDRNNFKVQTFEPGGGSSASKHVSLGGGEVGLSNANGSATLSLGTDGVLELDDANGTRDL